MNNLAIRALFPFDCRAALTLFVETEGITAVTCAPAKANASTYDHF